MAANLGKASSYGLYALVRMARNPGRRIAASDIAEEHGVSEHHVAKVLRALRRAGFVEGSRGAGGGYRLAREPDAMTMLEVVERLEGPQGVLGDATAPRCADASAVHAVLTELVEHRYYTLKSVTIATLARDDSVGAVGDASPRRSRLRDSASGCS